MKILQGKLRFDQIMADTVELPFLFLQLCRQLFRLILCLKIIICQIHAKHQLTLITALLPIAVQILTLCHLVIDIDGDLVKIFLTLISADLIDPTVYDHLYRIFHRHFIHILPSATPR